MFSYHKINKTQKIYQTTNQNNQFVWNVKNPWKRHKDYSNTFEHAKNADYHNNNYWKIIFILQTPSPLLKQTSKKACRLLIVTFFTKKSVIHTTHCSSLERIVSFIGQHGKKLTFGLPASVECIYVSHYAKVKKQMFLEYLANNLIL